jgi:Dolichyl-phosphate-mannose-protein mannosyltransferase
MFVIAALFLAALSIRLYQIDAPPLDFHPTRQYRSLIIARGFYFNGLTSIPAWERQVAHFSQQKQGVLEPPIMEFLVSIGYRILGGEHVWLSRLLSSLFWLIGGGFLYLIGKKIADADAALFGMAFYLFLPFAVVASRSFQPDPLMVTLILVSVFAILRYYDSPSNSHLVVAAVLAALAFVVKPGAVFTILGAFVALAISRQGVRRAVLSRTFLVFMTITLVPTFLIYTYATFTGTFLVGEAQKTLLPQLWLSVFFWRGWINNIGDTVGFIPLVGALLGTLMFRQGMPRALLVGLWAGYVIFGLSLNYNLATHNYYQLQLIPIVGLSIGPVIALIMNRLNQIHQQMPWRFAAWGVLLLALLLSLEISRSRLVNPDLEYEVKVEQEIGELVNHSTRTIFLSSDYGVPLEYNGLLSGSPWPLASDLEWERLAEVPSLSAEERFNAWFSKDSPDYFIVEDLQGFDKQPDLKQFLSRFSILSQNNDFMIYSLKGR